MICLKCSAVIPDGSLYCNICGASQTPRARSARKNANGTGSVYARNGKYVAVAQVYDPHRRTLQRAFTRKKDAVNALPDLRAQLLAAHGRDRTRPAVTLSSLYDGYEAGPMSKLSASKQTAYRIARRRIAPLDAAPISSLTINDLQQLITGLTYYQARDVKHLLSHLYQRAVAQQDVPTNLASFISLPPLEEKEAEPFTEDEVRALWTAFDSGDTFCGALLLMIYTGMMPGELIDAKKDMIDLEHQRIVGAGKKTKERRTRSIMLPDIILPVLAKLTAHPHQTILGMNKDRFYSEYHAATARAGVRDLPPYACRHTTSTALALGDNVAPLLITRIMRQTRPLTTERYKHAEEQTVLAALNTLSK